jgi:hypothetical protein
MAQPSANSGLQDDLTQAGCCVFNKFCGCSDAAIWIAERQAAAACAAAAMQDAGASCAEMTHAVVMAGSNDHHMHALSLSCLQVSML